MHFLFNDIFIINFCSLPVSPSLQVFHCVHFECPAQLDTEVKEGTPGLEPPNKDHSTQHAQHSQLQGLTAERSTTSSLHT